MFLIPIRETWEPNILQRLGWSCNYSFSCLTLGKLTSHWLYPPEQESSSPGSFRECKMEEVYLPTVLESFFHLAASLLWAVSTSLSLLILLEETYLNVFHPWSLHARTMKISLYPWPLNMSLWWVLGEKSKILT